MRVGKKAERRSRAREDEVQVEEMVAIAELGVGHAPDNGLISQRSTLLLTLGCRSWKRFMTRMFSPANQTWPIPNVESTCPRPALYSCHSQDAKLSLRPRKHSLGCIEEHVWSS
jgi:hypothetical protein